MSENKTNERIKLQSLSASQRWLTCTASLLYNDKPFMEKEVTVMGSLCHKISELMLRSHFFGEDHGEELKALRHDPFLSEDGKIAVKCTERLWGISENYATYAKSMAKEHAHPNQEVFIEEKVNLKFYGYDKIGYVDFMAVTPEAIVIVDLKTGRVPVSADVNSQMLLYAVATVQKNGLRERIITAIAQPVINAFDAYEYTPAMLGEWYAGQRQAMDEIAKNELVYRPSAKACKYCDHRDFCNERIKKGVC